MQPLLFGHAIFRMTTSKLMPNTEAELAQPVHVAVGIITRNNRVCVTQRHMHQHQGGKWEFPGGKVELGETASGALTRELKEELGINVSAAEPLLTLNYRYPDKHVLLDVWHISAFSGQATALEGQGLQWQAINTLDAALFPAANRAIIQALTLSAHYVITGSFNNPDDFTTKFQRCLSQGQRLIQLRANDLSADEYRNYARLAIRLCRDYDDNETPPQLILNSSIENVELCDADGVHLNSTQLMKLHSRPLTNEKLVGASVHNYEQLRRACDIEVDFVVIAPVLPTTSHPQAHPLGWETLQQLTKASSVLVYALGGMQKSSLAIARQHGAFGIAGISGFWL